METKPTLSKPISSQSKNFEKNFSRTMNQHNIKLEEIDFSLEENKDKIKKHKLFNLRRMESLVFPDPKLSAIYNKLENIGDVTMGVHVNENIMSYIFNRYVINDAMNLQKYKNTPIPQEKKKGRGESEINKLQKQGEEKMEKLGLKTNETTGSSSSGAFAPKTSFKQMDETTTSASSGAFSGPAAWSKSGQPARKPIWPMGTIIGESNYLTDPSGFKKYVDIINEQSNDDFMINNTAAFNSDTIKNWNEKDKEIEMDTLENDKMDESNVETIKEEGSMIDPNPTTMAFKADQSTMPMGLTNTGLKENKMDIFEEMKNELDAYSIHHKKLVKMTEERKSSSIVLRDRVGSENEKNFKKDLNHSGTKEIINIEKELQYKDQQTDVKNPQKLTQDIEKTELKATKGEAFENVGDSTNDKGNEIPKRNMNEKEQAEVDLYRNGQHSLRYDSKNERFDKRIKSEMGDKFYEMGQKQLKDREHMSMYNKGAQPTYREKKPTNIAEATITGKFTNLLGKRQLVDFNLVESMNINDKNIENLFELDFTGMGNVYSNKGDINESIVDVVSKYKFYTDGMKVVAIKTTKSLNENVDTKKVMVNEEFNKMQHLLGYKPKDYVNTKNVKTNRGF